MANCGWACGGGFDPGNVSAYTIDGTTGALTPVPGSPFPAGGIARSVTVDPTGRFAYVVNGFAAGTVSAFAIDQSTGALTPVVGSPFPAGWGPTSVTTSVTVDPTGQFAYVANCASACGAFGPGNVSAYTIDGTAYVANCASACGAFGPGNVSAYTIDGTTGALTPVNGSPFPAGEGPFSVTTTAGPPPPPARQDRP